MRRPSWLLTRLLPALAALLALLCWALALLPFVLAPLRQPVAEDRFAPFRPGATAPRMLSLSFGVYGCLFAANVWMLPRLTRLAPAVRGASTYLAVLVLLFVFGGTAGLVWFGWRVLPVALRLAGGRYGEGLEQEELESCLGLWWLGSGGAWLMLDLILLAGVGLARFGLGGSRLLPPGQVASFEDSTGLTVINWLGFLSTGCFLLHFVLLATGPSLSGIGDGLLWATLVTGFACPVLSGWLLVCVLKWVPTQLLRDDDSQPTSPGAVAFDFPPQAHPHGLHSTAPPPADQGIKPADEGYCEPG